MGEGRKSIVGDPGASIFRRTLLEMAAKPPVLISRRADAEVTPEDKGGAIADRAMTAGRPAITASTRLSAQVDILNQ